MGKASDTMTTLAENFHWRVTAWCLSLDGPTEAQPGGGGGGGLAQTVFEFRAIFFFRASFITLII